MTVRWYTIAELTAVPSLPDTERGVRELARRGGWHEDRRFWRQRKARGGGREYRAEALPVETRNWLAHQALKGAPIVAAAAEEIPEGDSAALRMDAALHILAAWDRQKPAGSLEVARGAFCQLYNARDLGLPEWVTEIRPTLSVNTLKRYERRRTKGDVKGLGGNYGNRKGGGVIDRDEEIKALVLGILADKPHATGKHIRAALEARFDDGRKLPSERAVQRWLGTWKAENRQILTAVADPDAWRNKYRAATGNASEGIERLNQLWELDSTPADVILNDGRRHAIIGVIDVYTRRLKLLVAPTSKASAIGQLLRRALLDWGVPEICKTDNGSDYISRHVTSVLSRLEIRQDLCQPFSPEQKPHIERAFGTLTRGLFELLPGYVGHSVAGRKAIENRRSFAQRLGEPETFNADLSAEELQTMCDRWCESAYEHDAHRGLGGRTPFEAAAGWAGAVRRIENERALDVLLAEAPDGGIRVPGKDGIRLDGGLFDSPDLAMWIGRPVAVRYDEADIGRVYCFDADGGAFICEAVNLAWLGSMDRQELAARKRADQKSRVSAARATLRAAGRKANTGELMADILAHRERRASGLAAFPRPVETYETPELAAAAEAAAGPKELDHLDENQIAAADALWQRLEGQSPEPPRLSVVGDPAEGPLLPASPQAPECAPAPTFADDRDLALHLLENRERLSPGEATWLIGRLQEPAFRLWLYVEKEAAAALVSDLRATALPKSMEA